MTVVGQDKIRLAQEEKADRILQGGRGHVHVDSRPDKSLEIACKWSSEDVPDM